MVGAQLTTSVNPARTRKALEGLVTLPCQSPIAPVSPQHHLHQHHPHRFLTDSSVDCLQPSHISQSSHNHLTLISHSSYSHIILTQHTHHHTDDPSPLVRNTDPRPSPQFSLETPGYSRPVYTEFTPRTSTRAVVSW